MARSEDLFAAFVKNNAPLPPDPPFGHEQRASSAMDLYLRDGSRLLTKRLIALASVACLSFFIWNFTSSLSSKSVTDILAEVVEDHGQNIDMPHAVYGHWDLLAEGLILNSSSR